MGLNATRLACALLLSFQCGVSCSNVLHRVRSRNAAPGRALTGLKAVSFVKQKRPCELIDLTLKKERAPYVSTWEQQKILLEEQASLARSTGTAQDFLICLEHEDVYTIGQAGEERNIKFSKGAEPVEKALLDNAPGRVLRVERGGDVTYHGPGQLVLYPIMDLRHAPCGKDLHIYLRDLEEVGILTLREFKVVGERSPGQTGVWIRGNNGVDLGKIQAIGVKVKSWITMHGLSFNVSPDLSMFEKIVPCGLNRPVCSLRKLGLSVSLLDVKEVMLKYFERIFQCRLSQSTILSGT
eukprot:Selendium_serpulae@DN3955_c0_g1_i2.p1